MRSDDDTTLRDFVASRYPRLRRSAFLMTGDWAHAGELARAALTCVVADSRRNRVADPDIYAWSELMHAVRHAPVRQALVRHAPGRREHVFVAAPGGRGEAPDTILVLDALHRLATRYRAVLVLRLWDGFGVEETADVLGVTDERVEAYEAAGLSAVEVLLAAAE